MNQNNDLINTGSGDEKEQKTRQKTERNIRRHKGIKMKDIIYYSQRGLSCMEIGKILGCSKQSISKRLIDWKKIQGNGGNTKLMTDIKTLKDVVLPQPIPLTPREPQKDSGFIIIRRW